MRAATRSARLALAALTLTAAALATAPAAVAQSPFGPRFGENYRLTSDTPARGRDIPGLAVNPANDNHIVEADVNPINLQCDYHVSFDGGRTWTGGHLTIANNGEIPPFPVPACDQNFDSGGYGHFNTGIVFGSGQNVYITFSAHRGPYNRPEGNSDGGAGDESVVARSTDGGRTFAPAVVAVPGGGPVSASPGLAGRGLRPQLAVQRGAGTGGQDRLYVASWHCYIKPRASSFTVNNPNGSRGGCSGGGGERRILVARSDDGGSTWTTPVLASAANVRTGTVTPPSNIPAGTGAAAEAGSTDEQAREPSQPVIGPDGAVYVAYRNRDITDGTTCPVNPLITGTAATTPAPGSYPTTKAHCIVVAKSVDQGATWTQTSTGQPVSTATLSNPRLAIDPTTPAGVGTLHVVYQRPVPGDPSDISLQSSTDGGQTWSAAVRVNDDPAGFIQTNPNVSVATGGRVDVIWGDRRHTYAGGFLGDTYFASLSAAGAPLGANRRITDRTFNLDVGSAHELGAELSPGFSWYGPVSAPLTNGRALAAWTDSREGTVDSAIQDIYLSPFDPGAAITGRTIATETAPGLSVMLSRLAYPGGTEGVGDRGGEPATRVVVAAQDDVAGALVGAVLARAKWGPLLLSPTAALPAAVQAEAARMRPTGGYLIGDTSSLSSAVSESVRAATRDGDGVVRVSAPLNIPANNRPAELAKRVAELMLPLSASPEAVIVNPDSSEAVAAAGLAAALRLPILFVDMRTTMPSPTANAISSLGIKKALIVGGTQAVPNGVRLQLEGLLGDTNVKRLDGADVYATSELAFAEGRTASATRGLPANVVYVADGARPIDATVLGAAVGRLNGLMLLTPSASVATAESRLVALGHDAAVDRLVAARGTGGTDPAPPALAPPPPPPPPPAAVPPPPVAPPPPPPAAVSLAGCPAAVGRLPILLTNANDTRNGTEGPDLIVGGSGNDVIDGRGAGDCIDLGPGTDRGLGGAGDDFVQGGLGNDVVRGGSGRDSLRGQSGNDRIEGDSGNDTSLGGTGGDTLLGGVGNDVLGGETGADSISGNSGADRLTGNSGNDRISGSSGDDRIYGNAGDDRLSGGTGADRISGGPGRDTISARDGRRDRITCGTGRDRVIADRRDQVSRDCESLRRG